MSSELSEPGRRPIRDVAGAILAGGMSSRLGVNKAFVRLGGRALVDIIAGVLKSVVSEVVIVANDEGPYPKEGIRLIPDIIRSKSPLAGIHAALSRIDATRCFVVGCDMPFISPELIAHMCELDSDADCVVPRHGGGFLEPLHAVYSKTCLQPVREALEMGRRRTVAFYDRVSVRYVEDSEIEPFGKPERLFFNINTPEDARKAQEWMAE